MNIIELR